jgi:hypothetical protein
MTCAATTLLVEGPSPSEGGGIWVDDEHIDRAANPLLYDDRCLHIFCIKNRVWDVSNAGKMYDFE